MITYVIGNTSPTETTQVLTITSRIFKLSIDNHSYVSSIIIRRYGEMDR
jgi:hypothetical protein